MRSVLFFIHIPKTAGTTVRQMLRRNLRSRLIEVPHVFFEGAIQKAKLEAWLNQDLGKLAVASHRLNLDLPLSVSGAFSGFAFAVIRDPVDWLASHYYYTRKPGIISFSKSDQFSSIDDYVQYLHSQMANPGFRPPSQLRALLPSTCTMEEDICRLLRQQRLFLLPQESLLEGLTALSMRFPELLKDPSMEQSNVNPRSRKPLSPETQDMAAELLSDDFRLHALAKKCLGDLVSDLDWNAYQGKLRIVRMKSRLRGGLLSRVQSFSERANRLIQCL